MEDSTRMIQKL